MKDSRLRKLNVEVNVFLILSQDLYTLQEE